MRSVVLWVFLSLLVASPVISAGGLMIKLGELPAQIEAGQSITVGMRGFSFDFVAPGEVLFDGTDITIELSFFACPITCEGEEFYYQIPLGQLPAGAYTVAADLDGVTLHTIEFEVVG